MEMSAWTTCNYRRQQRQTTGKQHGGKNIVSDKEQQDGIKSKKKMEEKKKKKRGKRWVRSLLSEDATGNKEATEGTVSHVM